MRILTIANLYPSKKNPEFGTFIKIIEDGIKDNLPGVKTDHVVIDNKPKNIVSKLFNYSRFYAGILSKLLFRKYDIVYVHMISFAAPALRLARLLTKPNLILNLHGNDLIPTLTTHKWLKKISSPLYDCCRNVIVPSDYFKNIVLDNYPNLPENRIIVSPSGGVQSSFFRKSNSVRKPTLQIGFVSRIAKGKGWDTFIKALDRLRKEGIDFHASIAGNGDMENVMRDMVTEYGLKNYVSILGALSHKELPDFFSKLDVFVFPSENKGESLGLVGIEAMAGSVPVIGSNIGGIPTYLKDSYNGFLFDPGNDLQLFNLLIKIRNLPDYQYISMKQNAYLSALSYESSAVINSLLDRLFPHADTLS